MACACGHAVGAGLLVCPKCGRLVHAADLKAIAASAEAHEAAGRVAEALGEWRRALVLLPPRTTQAAALREKIAALSTRVDALPKRGVGPIAGVVGAGALLLWKLKGLLFGLTKLSTLFSMLLAFAVYWQLWGTWFAAGFIAAMYVHEMGHVMALKRRGIAASAPMFIPGLGAFVRVQQYPIDPRENARVGLAGPVWGAAAAIVLWLVGLRYGGIWLGLARATAWLNLFNLLPIGGLDGGRGLSALSLLQRWLVTATMIGVWAATNEGLLLILALVTGFRALQKDAPAAGDARAFGEFVALILVLGALCGLIATPHT